uniref:Uncharacterized protein n=1 Tax=Mesocestoides corti TaxID=53468 RepID=A0A5K3FRR4_MESCO
MLSESPCLQGLIGPQMGLSTYNQRHLGFGLECVNTHPYLHPPQLWDWTNRPMPLQHACEMLNRRPNVRSSENDDCGCYASPRKHDSRRRRRNNAATEGQM